jgi:hypothetical protein
LKTKTVSLDFFEVSYRGKLPEIVDSFAFDAKNYIKRAYVNDGYFHNVYNLFLDFKKVGVLKCNPKTPIIAQDTIHFKVENHLLYTKNFQKPFIWLVINLHLKWKYVVEIHPAMDCIGYNIQDFMFKAHHDLHAFQGMDKGIKLKGRKKSFLPYGYTDGSQGTWYFGSNKSDKFIRIYDKTKEMIGSDKHYIEDFWELNGMDYKNNKVERIELVLKTPHLKGITIFDLEKPDFFASLCETHFRNYFDFYKTYTSHGKQYKKVLTPIDFQWFNTKKLDKTKYVAVGSLGAVERVMKQMYNHSLVEIQVTASGGDQSGVSLEHQQYIYSLLDRMETLYGIPGYVKSKVRDWERSFAVNRKLYMNRLNC